MNGVHDMGGMQGFGPVVPEIDEPRFHAAWERRVFALTLAMGGTGAWTLDQTRAARESLPPAHYLASSYYRIWLDGLDRMLRERGLATPDELADGRLRARPLPLPRVLTADRVPAALLRGSPVQRDAASPARFAVGDRVRARNVHPRTHTRLPRYCRGKPGTIARVHGAHVLADASATGAGELPQWLYTVRFAAADLWGADTTASAVHADLWESYLEAD
ncbi:MAG: nitrile hydratase subunit beta [Burkholderiales bacterium]